MLPYEMERGLFKLRADGPESEELLNADPRIGNLSPLFLAQNLSLPYPVTPLSGYKPSATSNLGIATPETAFTFLNTSVTHCLTLLSEQLKKCVKVVKPQRIFSFYGIKKEMR